MEAGGGSAGSGARIALRLFDLEGEERERAVPILIDGFVGIYRWHAKRTLRRIASVRGAEVDGELVGVSMLERLTPEVGYVYYVAVLALARRLGVGGSLLDDALARLRAVGSTVVYGAVEEENVASARLFLSRGFRRVERDERGYLEGGLGARGLRTRMMLVRGEVLFGRRFRTGEPPPRLPSDPGATEPSRVRKEPLDPIAAPNPASGGTPKPLPPGGTVEVDGGRSHRFMPGVSSAARPPRQSPAGSPSSLPSPLDTRRRGSCPGAHGRDTRSSWDRAKRE